jgi:HAD superfamily hydrolase (TIGR01509 family)
VVLGTLTREEGRTMRFLALFEACGANPSRKVALECAQIYRDVYLDARYPVAGAPALLRAVRAAGLTIGLVTNNTREEQEEKLEVIGLRRAIDFMLTSQEVRIHKPDPRIFQCALERGDTTPARSVMVGDSWDSDVVGASAAGIRAVWLNRKNRISPDPSLAAELPSLRPMHRAMQCVLAGSGPVRRRAGR